MSDRDADAAALAGAMPGWEYLAPIPKIRCPAALLFDDDTIPIPAADAPLHARLEFVGRMAEALIPSPHPSMNGARQSFVRRVLNECVDDDLVHAAIRAALAARRA